MGMGSQNQFNRRHTQRTEHKSLHNDYQERQSVKPIARWTI